MGNYEYTLLMRWNKIGEVCTSDTEEIGSFESLGETFDAMIYERDRKFEEVSVRSEETVSSDVYVIHRAYDKYNNCVGEYRCSLKLTWDYPYMRKFDTIVDYVEDIEYRYATYKVEKEIDNG